METEETLTDPTPAEGVSEDGLTAEDSAAIDAAFEAAAAEGLVFDDAPTPTDDTEPGSDGQEDTEPAGDAEATPDAPEIDPQYREIARRAKWSDEQLERFYASDPDLARATLDRVKSSFDEVASAAGRAGRQPTETEAPAPAEAGGVKADIDKIASSIREKLSEDFSDEAAEALTEGALRPLLGVIEQLASQVQPVQEHLQNQAVEQTFKQVDQFFGGLEHMSDVFGKGDRSSIAPENLKARAEVYEKAELLVAGANALGREIALNEALGMALRAVHSDAVVASEKKKTISNAKQRSARVVQRPSKTTAPAAGADDDPMQAAIDGMSEWEEKFGFKLG